MCGYIYIYMCVCVCVCVCVRYDTYLLKQSSYNDQRTLRFFFIFFVFSFQNNFLKWDTFTQGIVVKTPIHETLVYDSRLLYPLNIFVLSRTYTHHTLTQENIKPFTSWRRCKTLETLVEQKNNSQTNPSCKFFLKLYIHIYIYIYIYIWEK